MIDPRNTFAVPTNDKLYDGSPTGISQIWLRFFIEMFNRLMPLGVERSFNFIPNGAPQAISGLQFSNRTENAIIVDFFIQRISTTAGGNPGQEKNEIGTLYIYYSPRANTWRMTKVSSLSSTSSDCTISIDSTTSQVSISGSALTGQNVVNKITWRARSLGARLLRQSGWDA